MNKEIYVVLAGGVGAAKFIEGLTKVIKPEKLKVVINTGDDIELFGLQICPDIDIITYTLASVIDKKKGWGFKEETFNCLKVLKTYYNTGWFNAGDKDLATHIYRTDLLRRGFSKVEVTKCICNKLGVRSELIPMCNEPFETIIETPEKKMHFEEYYIKYQCTPIIKDVIFKGKHSAKPVATVLNYILDAKKIIICPSNPIVSIGTILSVKGYRDTLKQVKQKIFAISPLIEGKTVKGPADKLMKWKGLDVSCFGVAQYYRDLIGHFIIDIRDAKYKSSIEQQFKLKTYAYDTLMVNIQKKKNLAQFVVDL
ncbi:MAG: 2-phospho-L-lactate transferase [Promethearchaeota archaeon]|nr:MAG: 2-phospho-L-lactate transferase [Candidatus Lokiarchaeota archaeon]